MGQNMRGENSRLSVELNVPRRARLAGVSHAKSLGREAFVAETRGAGKQQGPGSAAAQYLR
eukprot:5943238-Pleurochrysis_carterae.AAC.1